MGYEKVHAPPLDRPGGDCIPDDNGKKSQTECINDVIDEQSPGQDFVSFGVFRIDAEHFFQDRFRCKGDFRNDFAFLIIGAPVQHAVKIESLTAAQQGTNDIERDRNDHGDQRELIRVDREFMRIHFPHDPGIHRSGNRRKKFPDRFHQSMRLQPWINMAGPGILHQESADPDHCPAYEGSKSPKRRTEAAVQSEYDGGAGTAQPNQSGYLHEHDDVIKLSEKD